MAFLVERPINRSIAAACRIALDVGFGPKIIGDNAAQMIRVIGRIRDDMSDAAQPFDQASRLRAVAPLTRRDDEPDRQPKRVNNGVDLGPLSAIAGNRLPGNG